MEQAEIWPYLLQLAQQAAEQGEVPISALIMQGEQMIASAHNQVEQRGDATAHAEMLVLHAAAEQLGTKCLSDCDLYVSLEPCIMCAGAIAHARIRRVYFGAYDPKAGALMHGARLFEQPYCHHRPEVYGGFYETACSELLQTFFSGKR